MLVLRMKIGEEVLTGPASALPYPQEMDVNPDYARTTRFRLVSADRAGACVAVTVAGVPTAPQVLACEEGVREGVTNFTILGLEREGERVKVGITAPADVRVVRGSLYLEGRRRRAQQLHQRAVSA